MKKLLIITIGILTLTTLTGCLKRDKMEDIKVDFKLIIVVLFHFSLTGQTRVARKCLHSLCV